jgi:hypothetical protein
MTDERLNISPAQRTPSARDDDTFTHVELIWVEKKIEYWIRFGQVATTRIADRHRRIVGFAPGTIFAFIRWASNDYGTILSRIDLVRAVSSGQSFQTLPFVRPGGDILLTVEGWPKMERVLQIIDAIEALGIDPADVAPEYWRHVYHRLTARQAPRSYTGTRHSAWLKRRRVSP